jgi:hypothetical protein
LHALERRGMYGKYEGRRRLGEIRYKWNNIKIIKK